MAKSCELSRVEVEVQHLKEEWLEKERKARIRKEKQSGREEQIKVYSEA